MVAQVMAAPVGADEIARIARVRVEGEAAARRARMTRPRISALVGPCVARSPPMMRGTGGTSTWMSMRSRIGPDRRPK